MGFQVSHGLLELIYRFIFVNAGTLRNFTTALTGQDSSVGIATRYGLEVPGIESRLGRDFPHLSRPALGLTQPRVQRYRVFPGGKGGRVVTLTTHPI